MKDNAAKREDWLSMDPTPSEPDIRVTRDLARAGMKVFPPKEEKFFPAPEGLRWREEQLLALRCRAFDPGSEFYVSPGTATPRAEQTVKCRFRSGRARIRA